MGSTMTRRKEDIAESSFCLQPVSVHKPVKKRTMTYYKT